MIVLGGLVPHDRLRCKTRACNVTAGLWGYGGVWRVFRHFQSLTTRNLTFADSKLISTKREIQAKRALLADLADLRRVF